LTGPLPSLGFARGEDDRWELTTSVGLTAMMVTALRALASQDPRSLLDDRFAAPLVRAVGHEYFTRLVDGEVRMPTGSSAFDQQFMCEQMAVRTRFFDDFLLGAAAAGLRQLVILAAGLDARAFRLPWPEGTVVFEVDQPAVVAVKTRALSELGATPQADYRPVGIDLREAWPTALRTAGFVVTQPTAWIAEGLLVYLPAQAQDRLLDDIRALSAPSSRIAIDHIPDMGSFCDHRGQTWRDHWQRSGLDLDVASMVWGGPRREPALHLAVHGWHTAATTAVQLYPANGLAFPDDPALDGFRDITYITAELGRPGGPVTRGVRPVLP